MPKNTLLFPPNFVFDSIGAESGISGLQIAVNNLAVASKSGAMRQAHALGVSGRNSIKNQNKGMPTLNSLLPTRSVGKYTVAPSALSGTVGLFTNGWGDTSAGSISTQRLQTDRFTFVTDTIVSLGARNPAPHLHYGIANSVNGYLLIIVDSNQIWRLPFQTETLALLGGTLFPARYYGASLKNQSRGYACAGSNGGTVFGNVDRFTFVGEVCVSIASFLQTRNGCSGFGNRFNGYIAGGFANGVYTLPTNNTERFSYASESNVAISAFLSLSRAELTTWTPGSVLASYVMSGNAYGRFPDPNTSVVRLYYSNAIDKFTFTGETCAALGATLSKGSSNSGAVGNTTRCVIGGGQSHTDSITTQQTKTVQSNAMYAIEFATETSAVLGCVLSAGRLHLTGIDNSSF
jgi:hypothetical protein